MAQTILVTRPAHQNQHLNDALQQVGFSVISFPTITIVPAAETEFLRNLERNISAYDIALFVSRNAVDHTFRHLDPAALPPTLQLGVIGKGTWGALKGLGIESHAIPADSFNSEGLLASPTLQQVSGKRVVIFRGQQGRNLLGETLHQRGARVDHVEVYRRELPQYPPGYLSALCVAGFPDLVVFTSGEGMVNCFALLTAAEAQRIRAADWLLISERMRETARDLRHNASIIIADSASDDGILTAIQKWRQAKV